MPIDKGMRYGRFGLFLVKTQKPGYSSCGGDFDIDNMVKANFIIGIPYLENALDFVGFDQSLKDSRNGYSFLPRAVEDIGNSENGT